MLTALVLSLVVVAVLVTPRRTVDEALLWDVDVPLWWLTDVGEERAYDD